MFKYNLDTTKEITKAALIGQAIGDAFGMPLEFLSRAQVRAIGLKDMVGKDTGVNFHSHWASILPAGTWTDDTSMTVAAMDSIIRRGGINYNDIMQRFLDWQRNGLYSPVHYCFDIGGTTSEALHRYSQGIPAIECGPSGIRDNGNGALMRILPFSLYCIYKGLGIGDTVDLISEASGLTHGHAISKLGCVIFTVFLKMLLCSKSILSAWEYTRRIDYRLWFSVETIDAYADLLSDDFIKHAEECIGETGYVVDALMTAVYSMLTGQDYESTILTAASMGFDTDTNAAITGALAGAFYGIDDIPDRWLSKLLDMEYLENIASDFTDSIFNA